MIAPRSALSLFILAILAVSAIPETPEQAAPAGAQQPLKEVMALMSEVRKPSERKTAEQGALLQLGQTFMSKVHEISDKVHASGEDVLAKDLTELLASMADPQDPLDEEEKHVIQELIHGFTSVFIPPEEIPHADWKLKDFMALSSQFTGLLNAIATPPHTHSHDAALGAQALLAEPEQSPEQSAGIPNEAALAEMTARFLDTLEKQFGTPQNDKQ